MKKIEYVKAMEYRGNGPHGIYFTQKELREAGIKTNDRLRVILIKEESE